MNKKQMSLLKILIDETTPVTAKELAAYSNLSLRTVREEIRGLKNELDEHSVKLISKTNWGYSLEVSESEKQRIYEELTQNEPPHLDNVEREYLIIQLLINVNDYMKVQEIAEALFVSESTISKAMMKCHDILANNNLIMEKKPHKGVKISGNEIDKRSMLSVILMKEMDYGNSMTNPNAYQTANSSDLFYRTKELVSQELERNEIYSPEYQLDSMIGYLLVAQSRVKMNCLIPKKEKNEVFENPLLIEAFRQLLLQQFQVEFPGFEIEHLLMRVMLSEKNNMNQQNIRNIIDKTLRDIDLIFGISVHQNKKLVVAITQHVLPMIDRIITGTTVVNPMISTIRSKHPFSFSIASTFCSFLGSKLKLFIPEGERAFLVLHFECHFLGFSEKKKRALLLCGTGQGTAMLLKQQVELELGEMLEVVDTVSVISLADFHSDMYDLVLSTIPINVPINKPTIYLPLFLNQESLKDIATEVRQVTKGSQEFVSYFPEDKIFINRSIGSQMEVFQFLDDKLHQEIQVAPGVLTENLLAREEIVSTALGNCVAMPHPLRLTVDEQFISLITLDQAVKWGDQMVKVVFLIMLQKVDGLEELYKYLSRVFTSKKMVQSLIEAKNPKAAIEILYSFTG